MTKLLLASLILVGCGQAVEQFDHCDPSQYSQTRCSYGVVQECEPSIAPCYDYQLTDGRCDSLPDGGAPAPELGDIKDVWVSLNTACP